jgi:transcriptional regulator with XRE-family HTH domain
LEDIRHLLGRRVRELREASGLTQEQLAEKSELHPNYIGRIERAQSNVSLEIIQKIAWGLRVELSSIFEWDEPAESETLQKIQLMLKTWNDQQLKVMLDHIEGLHPWFHPKR